MRNPLKSVKKSISKRFGKDTGDPGAPTYPELRVIWPTGTWKLDLEQFARMRVDGDTQIARAIILDTWAYEVYDSAVKRAGYELNPGMFGTYPPAIPSGWRPSEKGLKALYAKKGWDVETLHYVVAELENLGHIRP